MKKLITLLVLVLIGTTQTWADGVMYLRNNISTNWDIDDENFKSEKTWDSTNSQDVYEFTINASTLGNNDFYFRLNRYDSDGKLIGPYNHQDYVFTFENGANETYTAPRIDKFQGNNGAFKIAHSTIKANQYKITVYLKYSDNVTVDNTQYNGVWVYYIKVEIVDMPVSVGAKGFATYCNADRALDFTGKSIKAYTISSTDGSALTLTPKNKVAKGEPVLLYSETPSDQQNISVIVSSEATADAANKLVAGDGEEHTWVENTTEHYILYTGGTTPGFYRANKSVVAVGKAYLNLTGLPSQARSFDLNMEDEVITGINAVENINVSNAIYNLNGQRVAQPAKGLYIMNGKKVIIK